MKRPSAPIPGPNDSFNDEMTPVEAYLDEIAETGMHELAAIIHDLNLEALRNTDPLFAKLERQALAKFQRRIVAQISDMAMNGVEEDIVHKGDVTGTKRRHSDALTIRFLETVVPAFQKVEKKEVKTVDGTSDATVAALENLSDEILAEIREKIDGNS